MRKASVEGDDELVAEAMELTGARCVDALLHHRPDRTQFQADPSNYSVA